MSKYSVYKDSVQDKINKFPIMFAYSNEQFLEGLNKLGVSSKKDLISIGGGGFIRETDKDSYIELINSIDKELKDKISSDDEFVLDMFGYELANHEYCISFDDEDVIDACGLDIDSVNKDNRLKKLYLSARKSYLKEIQEQE